MVAGTVTARGRHNTRWVVLGFIAVLVLGVGAWAYRVLRVEAIPETLDPMRADSSPEDIRIPGRAGQDDLVLADLHGNTVFLVLEGKQSGESGEGRNLHRALNRWVYPEHVEGFVIGDALGFGLFKSKIDEVMKHFADEVRFPFYVDYKGAISQTFSLPKGHSGFVVLAKHSLWTTTS